MRTIKFTKGFAGKKKDDEYTCDGMLASQLVRVDKVAKYIETPTTESDNELDNLKIDLDKTAKLNEEFVASNEELVKENDSLKNDIEALKKSLESKGKEVKSKEVKK